MEQESWNTFLPWYNFNPLDLTNHCTMEHPIRLLDALESATRVITLEIAKGDHPRAHCIIWFWSEWKMLLMEPKIKKIGFVIHGLM